MAERVKKDTKKSRKESAAQAAEDLKVIFPDVTLTIAGETIVVGEYPFLKWLELKPQCGEIIESLSELLTQSDEVTTDEFLEFFENHFQEIQILITESIQRDEQYLADLKDVDMQNLLFTWWQVNKHFFLRSAYRLVRTKTQPQSDGQPSSSPSSVPDTKSQT